MSVSLLAQDSGRAFQLGNAVSFGSIRGNTLTLDSLVVNNITANKITVGDDALPDIYYYGQAPASRLLGIGATFGSATPRPSLVDYTNLPGNTGYAVNTRVAGSAPGNAGTNTGTIALNNTVIGVANGNSSIIKFPSPLHYTLTSAADALNPYVSATIITAGTDIQNNVSPQPYVARIRLGLQSCTPSIALRQVTANGLINGAILPQTDGMWICLPLLASAGGGTITDGYSPMSDLFGSTGAPPTAQVCWYIIGCAPTTPPATFVGGTVTSTAIENMAPYAPFPGTPSSSKFVVNFTGGILGSAVQFPNAGQVVPYTTLGNFLAPDATTSVDYSYPPVVFPSNGSTAGNALNALTANPCIDAQGLLQDPPFLLTNSIWIQQLWWVSTLPSSGAVLPAGALRGACYNVTHLFTNVGNSDNSTRARTAQYPLNAATIKVSARAPATPGQDARDGAFDVTINLPRTVLCAPAGTGEVRMPTYANQFGILPDIPSTAGATFDAVPAFGYWVCLLGTISTGGADMSSVRASDGTVPPEGKAGNFASYTTGVGQFRSLGQFSWLANNWGTANPVANFTYVAGSSATGGKVNWESTPVNPKNSDPTWYTNVINPSGLLVLIPPA